MSSSCVYNEKNPILTLLTEACPYLFDALVHASRWSQCPWCVGMCAASVHCKVYSVHCTLCGVQCTPHSVHCTLCGICTLHSVQCTLCSVQCTPHSAQCTPHSVHCTLCGICSPAVERRRNTHPDGPNVMWSDNLLMV